MLTIVFHFHISLLYNTISYTLVAVDYYCTRTVTFCETSIIHSFRRQVYNAITLKYKENVPDFATTVIRPQGMLANGYGADKVNQLLVAKIYAQKLNFKASKTELTAVGLGLVSSYYIHQEMAILWTPNL